MSLKKNNNDSVNIIKAMADDLWGKTNIHFVSLVKVYDDQTCAVIANKKAWTDYFIKNYMTKKSTLSRLWLGGNFWSQSKNQLLLEAVEEASKNFHLSSLLDIVKISTHEVGCYAIYTFAVDQYNRTFFEDIYKVNKKTMLYFIGGLEQKARQIILSQSHPDNRIVIPGDNGIDAEEYVNYWATNWEHIAENIGHQAKLL